MSRIEYSKWIIRIYPDATLMDYMKLGRDHDYSFVALWTTFILKSQTWNSFYYFSKEDVLDQAVLYTKKTYKYANSASVYPWSIDQCQECKTMILGNNFRLRSYKLYF